MMMPPMMRYVVAQGGRWIVSRRQFTTSTHCTCCECRKDYSLFAHAGSAGVIVLGIEGFRRYMGYEWDNETEMDVEKMKMENEKLEAELDAEVEKLKMKMKKMAQRG